MMILFILCVVCVVYFMWRMYNGYAEVVYVESDVDGRRYMIRRGTSKSSVYLKQSANALAEVNARIEKLIKHVQEQYKDDPYKNYFIKKLAQNYNASILSEAAVDERYTTFTVDKQDIHICLRTRDVSEKLYDIDLLMYVVLHELAHLCNYDKSGNPIHGHGSEFVYIFKFLVVESIKLELYRHKDYSKNPQEYCGIMINTSVLPDEKYDFYIK